MHPSGALYRSVWPIASLRALRRAWPVLDSNEPNDPIGRSCCGANLLAQASADLAKRLAASTALPVLGKDLLPLINRRRCRGRPRDAPSGIPQNLCGTAIPWPSRLPSGYVPIDRRTPARAPGQTGCSALGGGEVAVPPLAPRSLLEEGPCLSVDPSMSANRTLERTVSTSGGWRSALQEARVSSMTEGCRSVAASDGRGWQTASGISDAVAAACSSIQSSASPLSEGRPLGFSPSRCFVRGRAWRRCPPASGRP